MQAVGVPVLDKVPGYNLYIGGEVSHTRRWHINLVTHLGKLVFMQTYDCHGAFSTSPETPTTALLQVAGVIRRVLLPFQ